MNVPVAAFRRWLVRIGVRQPRRILIAGGMTVAISALLLTLVSLNRWRHEAALRTDTGAAVAQAAQQVVRALESRRGSLTFIRDTLNRSQDLTLSQLQAMGTSATLHTRHMIGAGLIRSGAAGPVWWHGPAGLSRAEQVRLNRAIRDRRQLRGVWRNPSTFVIEVSPAKPVLVMLEPLTASSYRQSAIIGVFSLSPLLEDLFVRIVQRAPVQISDGQKAIYTSSDWTMASGETRAPITVQEGLRVDALRWMLRMQPGNTRVVRTLTGTHVLLVTLSLIAGLGLTVIVWLLAARAAILQRLVNRRTAALRRTSERLRQLATTDELTGLSNRRFFMERWTREYERAKRYGRPLTCLMIDVNGFKKVNDTLGHHAGDLILKDVAKELRAALRTTDILARLGGDEFVIALPETSTDQAGLVADKLRRVSLTVAGQTRGHTVPPVRLSVGLSQIADDHRRPEDLLQAADRSLYAQKRQQPAPASTPS